MQINADYCTVRRAYAVRMCSCEYLGTVTNMQINADYCAVR